MKILNKNLQKINYLKFVNINKTKKNNLFYLLLGGVVGFINGFFGGGGGMLCVPGLILGGKNDKEAHATTLFVMLPLSIVSFVVYILIQDINLKNSLFVVIGFVVGGFVGAILLKKLKSVWIEAIFCVVTIGCGVRMIIGG